MSFLHVPHIFLCNPPPVLGSVVVLVTVMAVIKTIGVSIVDVSVDGNLEIVVVTIIVYTIRVVVKVILIYFILREGRGGEKEEYIT